MSDLIFDSKLTLTPGQGKIEASKAKKKIVKAGRQFGKTKYAASWQTRKAWEMPKSTHWYVAPTYNMASEIAFDEYLDQLPEEVVVKNDRRQLYIELINGSKIWFKGSEKRENLRGRTLGSLVMDEAAFQDRDVFEKILSPMLLVRQAPVLIISSPRKGWFTELWKTVKAGADPDFEAFHFTIYDNPYVAKDEIEKQKSKTPEHVWRQEYLAEDIDFEGQVYSEFEAQRSVFSPANDYHGHIKWPCVLGADWGHDDPTAAIWIHINQDGADKGKVVVSREHVKGGADIEIHASAIKIVSRGRNLEQSNYVLDQSAFKRDPTSQLSVSDVFRKELGFPFQRSEKDVNVGIDLLKRFLRGDENGSWLKISSTCTKTIEAFERWEYGQHEPDPLAALRYALRHAVKRGLTKLAEITPRLAHPADTSDLDIARLTGLKPPKNLFHRESWGWDSEAGIPVIQ